MHKVKTIVGNKYHMLEVIEQDGVVITCKCDCGKIKKFIKHNVTRKNNSTKSCGCYNKLVASQRIKQRNINDWKLIDTGSKLIIYDWWANFIKRSKERNLIIDVTPIQLEELFLKQKGKCAFTGLSIELAINCHDRRNGIATASLDRIDNNKPYLSDNIQWVHKIINIMRRSLTIEDFIKWCKLVANNN